jgi:E3 ubiquitin-protein ligase TRAF7
LFSGSFDHSIKVWDLDTFACVKSLGGHKGYVHAITLGSNYIFSGSGDKTIKVRNNMMIY